MNILLAFLLILIAAILIYVFYQLLSANKKSAELEAKFNDQKTKYDDAINICTQRTKDLEDENQLLSRWKGIADADAKASELLTTAQAALDKATSDAAQLTADAQQKADTLITNAKNNANMISSEAKQQVKEIKDEVNTSLSLATSKAKEIIAAAEKRAEEIAGSAYESMKNASLFEMTVKAMKNILEGYGNQYIIPSRSLLDGLAQDIGHTEAGRELKNARERTRVMVRNGTAATCDYVEENRRSTAINFVIDAFNGKVDSILSRVRHDNAGTLEQEIRDAFTLVNYNGRAFREARITEEYLSARLEELKWAAIAQLLRLEEREEQRRIKEQIREEEKARKEYERAMRDAAKDEEVLRKAMEKAQQQIERASAEQRIKYEEQLRELTLKLKEAEERSQRALSMAQQTKRGHVYIISNIGSFGENVYKIGLTRRLEPLDRIRELGDSSVPFDFDVHAMLFSEDAPALETKLHKNFLMSQINKTKQPSTISRGVLRRVDFKSTVIRNRFAFLLLNILLYQLIRYVSGTYGKVSATP